jgi:Ras-related protein Rab-1A
MQAGQERFRAIVTSYYRGAHGIILAYDVTDPDSLRHVAHVWLKEVERHAHSQAKLILVGNKVDLASQCPERVALTRAMAKELLASSEGRIVGHVETSAKTGANVSDAFMGLIDALMVDRNARAVLRGKKGDTHRLSGGAAIPLSERAGFCAC